MYKCLLTKPMNNNRLLSSYKKRYTLLKIYIHIYIYINGLLILLLNLVTFENNINVIEVHEPKDLIIVICYNFDNLPTSSIVDLFQFLFFFLKKHSPPKTPIKRYIYIYMIKKI